MDDLTERERQIVAWLRETLISDLAALPNATVTDPSAALSGLVARACIATAIEHGEPWKGQTNGN